MDGLMEACGWIEELSSSNNLGDDVSNAVQVCFEELASNVVRHGGDAQWAKPPSHEAQGPSPLLMRVDFAINPKSVRLSLEDNGKPFDIAAAQTHGVNQPLADMPIGGLGIHLVKELASALSYARTEFGNQVNLEFSRLPVQEPMDH
jgi:sigma-B regulation protein RsbU (phosphoserine phosphatase)